MVNTELLVKFLEAHIVVMALLTSLMVGWVLKHAFPKFPNRYIPLVLPVLAVFMNVWINEFKFTPDIFFNGLLSGCGAVGLHQALAPYVNKIIDKYVRRILGKEITDEVGD